MVWALFLLRPYLQGTRFVVRTDHKALRWMLHMDGAHGRLVRWRLRLAEFDYTVETKPGRYHHAADTMSRLETTGVDKTPIPEELPLLTLANFARGWTKPDYRADKDYTPLTVDRLLKAQAEDKRTQAVRKEMDRNTHSRFGESPEGLLVRLSPLDRAVQVYVPVPLRQEVLRLEHDPAHAGHPGMNKMYTSMRRTYYWESMAADVYTYVAQCAACSRRTVGNRRRTNLLRLFPAAHPFTDVTLDLLGPLPVTKAGNRFLLVIVDRFTKMTRVTPMPREDAETVASAFCDTWVASYGPPNTLLTDNGTQLTSNYFRGVCNMMGIRTKTSTTYHPQTQGQVKRYNRTIVNQLKVYVEEHQDRWDELVSILSLAYNSRPQKNTGVAPLEFVVPDRVRTMSLERLPASPYPSTGAPKTAKDWREYQRARIRNLVYKVRLALAASQRRYKRAYDARVHEVNKAIEVGDWVYLDSFADKARKKLDPTVTGLHKVVGRGERTFTVLLDGYPEVVSSDHVARAPVPQGQEDVESARGQPQEAVVPVDREDTGEEYVWERFVDHDKGDDGRLWLLTRWWGYSPAEDTWEPWTKFDRAKVDQ